MNENNTFIGWNKASYSKITTNDDKLIVLKDEFYSLVGKRNILEYEMKK